MLAVIEGLGTRLEGEYMQAKQSKTGARKDLGTSDLSTYCLPPGQGCC